MGQQLFPGELANVTDKLRCNKSEVSQKLPRGRKLMINLTHGIRQARA